MCESVRGILKYILDVEQSCRLAANHTKLRMLRAIDRRPYQHSSANERGLGHLADMPETQANIGTHVSQPRHFSEEKWY